MEELDSDGERDRGPDLLGRLGTEHQIRTLVLEPSDPQLLLISCSATGARLVQDRGPAYNTRVIIAGMRTVSWHNDADLELNKLPVPERVAMLPCSRQAQGPRAAAAYPHQSSVRGAQGLRELRPRGGRSPWRAFCQRHGDAFVTGAAGPEAKVDPRGFDKAVRDALARPERQQ